MTRSIAQVGRVEGGHYLGDLEEWRELVATLPDGEYVLRLSPVSVALRSKAQNSRYWLLLSKISEISGDHPEDLHEYFKSRFLSREFFMTDASGQIRDVRRVTESTTRQTPARFADYVSQVEQFALEFFGVEGFLEG